MKLFKLSRQVLLPLQVAGAATSASIRSVLRQPGCKTGRVPGRPAL